MSDFDHINQRAKRRQDMLAFISRCGYVSNQELCQRFFISEPTVRRELSILEQEGLIRRSRGGAAAISGSFLQPIAFRLGSRQEEKKRIAECAASLVSDGDILFIDTSTTAFQLLRFLDTGKELTVVTNSVHVLEYFAAQTYGTKIVCKCTGGDLSYGSRGLVGRQAERYVASIRADWMFFSTPCLSGNGRISDYSEQETYLRIAMLENTAKPVFLFDSSKYNREAPFTVARLHQMAFAISNLIPPQDLHNMCPFLQV